MMNSLHRHRDAVLALIKQHHQPGQRLLIAIAGPPGSGKSTLAESVVTALNADANADHHAALLPMDGFHLDTDMLVERGLVARRGAPEIFDAAGFVKLIKAVRTSRDDIRYPVYDRSEERAIADAATLTADTEIVVVEGNYLLLETSPWNQLKIYFDAQVLLSCSLETLERRLMTRWLKFGYKPKEAVEKVAGNDLKNARLVIEHSTKADLTLSDEILVQ